VWAARGAFGLQCVLSWVAMAGSRCWIVESKETEIQIKGGTLGVRIFERCKGKLRSIFLQRAELASLFGWRA
jgi:hypothetical protein